MNKIIDNKQCTILYNVEYLGIIIDYSSPSKVIFSMIDYIGKIIDYIP